MLAKLSFIIFLCIFVAVVCFILYALFFVKREESELLPDLQKRFGGSFCSTAPGRKMLQFLSSEGKTLIGYWQQRGPGSRFLKPYLSLRFSPNVRQEVPEFWLVAKVGFAKMQIEGFLRCEESIKIVNRDFWLFVRSDISEQDKGSLKESIASNTIPLVTQTVVTELVFLNGTFSLLVQENITDPARVEERLTQAKAVFSKLLAA